MGGGGLGHQGVYGDQGIMGLYRDCLGNAHIKSTTSVGLRQGVVNHRCHLHRENVELGATIYGPHHGTEAQISVSGLPPADRPKAVTSMKGSHPR